MIHFMVAFILRHTVYGMCKECWMLHPLSHCPGGFQIFHRGDPDEEILHRGDPDEEIFHRDHLSEEILH